MVWTVMYLQVVGGTLIFGKQTKSSDFLRINITPDKRMEFIGTDMSELGNILYLHPLGCIGD